MERIEDKPIFDAEDMLERLGGDEEFLDDVLEVFIDECPKMLNVLRSAVTAADAREVERAAHAMKGALLNISADPAAGIAVVMETMGRTDDLDNCTEVFSAIETAMKQLERELEAFRARAALG